MKYLSLLILSIIILFQSCKKEEPQASLLTGDIKVDTLIQAIQEVQFKDVYLMKEYALRLSDMEGNKGAQLIGRAYAKIADFYTYDEDGVLKELEEVYLLLKSDKYSSLRLEIDILLIDHYYLGNLYTKAADRLDFVIEYIFQPKFELEKQIFLNGIITKYFHIDKKERLNKLLELSKQFEDKPWTYWKSRLNHSIGLCHYYLEEKEKTKTTFEYTLPNDIESGILNQAIEACLFLAAVTDDNKAIEYMQSAIAMAKQSGHTRLISMVYRTLGHHYFNLEDFEAAEESYRKAIEGDYFHPESVPSGVDYVYIGYSLFKVDSINFKKSIQLFDKAFDIAIASDDIVSEKIALKRKMWILRESGRSKEASEVEKQLNKARTKDQRDNLAVEDFYFNTRLKILAKDNKIELLSKNLELKSQLLTRQKIILALSSLSILLLVGLLYYFWQKALMLKQIKARNIIIEKQMKEIELINEEQKIELKQKLLVLSNNQNIINKVISLIKAGSEIPVKEKKKLMDILKSTLNKNIIEEIDFKFIKLHSEFQKKLSTKHPNLTTNNLKMSIYIKMNLSTREIASLKFKSPESVKVAKSRLKKKLEIPSGMTLNTYLNSM